MSPECEKYAADIIALKRPTTLEKLGDAIPKPKGAIPNFGLPKWRVMPMESKIPMVPGPEGAYNFTRRKIGEGLWLSAAEAEFNLSDPYGYEIKWTYDSLHDKHLVPYFSRPNIIRQLIKSGLITDNLDAKCSLRDYNMYRKYLRRLHCDSIKKELKRRAQRSIEARAIYYAEQQAHKEVKRLQDRERLAQIRSSVIREQQLAQQMKLEKQKEKQMKVEERLQSLVLKRKEERRLRVIKSKAREEVIRQKQRAAANSAQQKIIHTLLEWRKKERVRKKITETRLLEEKEQKLRLVEQKWEERKDFQEKQIEKEQILLQCIEERREQFINRYNEKVKKEAQRMKKLFQNAKMYIQCYLARKLPGSRERICCSRYLDVEEEDTFSSYSKDRKGSIDQRNDTFAARKQDRKRSIRQNDDSFAVRKQDRKRSIDQNDDTFTARKQDRKRSIDQNDDTFTERKQDRNRNLKVKKRTVGKTKAEQDRSKKKRKMRPKVDVQGRRKIKRRRRKFKTQEEKVDEEEETESEMKSDLEATPESGPTTKSDTSGASTTSTFKDTCRCQIIKNAGKEFRQ